MSILRRLIGPALFALLTAGCDAASSPMTDDLGEGGVGGAAGQGGAAAEDYAELYACVESDFGDVHALGGTGFDPATGLIGTPQESYVVSTTMLYWRAEKTDEFYDMGGKVMAQLASTPGLVAYALGTDETCRVGRAITIWRSEEDMFAFVVSGAHGEATGMTLDLSYTGKGTHWNAPPEEVNQLDWDVARQKLAEVEINPIYD